MENKKKSYFKNNSYREVLKKSKPTIGSVLRGESEILMKGPDKGYYEDDEMTKWAMQKDRMIMDRIEKLARLNAEQGEILQQLVTGNLNQKKRKSRKR